MRVAEEAADDDRELVSRRRRILGKPAIALHRVAMAAVRRLPPPRSRGRRGRPRSADRLTNAHAMGGTVRATLNLARHLAERHEVELIAIRRRCEAQAVLRVPGRASASRRSTTAAPTGAAGSSGCSSGCPSLLVHPEDYAYPASSVWTDLQLVRRLRAAGGDIVITTRPAWALLAEAVAAPGAVVIAQEHMHFNAHRPALAAAIRRRYGALDALAVLTEGDREDYARELAAAAADRAHPERGRAARRRAGGARREGHRRGRPAHLAEGLRPPDPRVRPGRPGTPRLAAADLRRRPRPRGAARPDPRRGPARRRVPDGPDEAARRGDRRREPVRALLALRGLRDGDRRGDERRPAGRLLRLPARPVRDHHARHATACSCRPRTCPG